MTIEKLETAHVFSHLKGLTTTDFVLGQSTNIYAQFAIDDSYK